MPRTLVIGDIHGGLRALVQVLERSSINPFDILVFLGDYVDGWSESAQVVEFLIKLEKNQKCIFIKGNHDVWAEKWLRYEEKDSVWLANGGQETINSYKNYSNEKKLIQLHFFALSSSITAHRLLVACVACIGPLYPSFTSFGIRPQ